MNDKLIRQLQKIELNEEVTSEEKRDLAVIDRLRQKSKSTVEFKKAVFELVQQKLKSGEHVSNTLRDFLTGCEEIDAQKLSQKWKKYNLKSKLKDLVSFHITYHYEDQDCFEIDEEINQVIRKFVPGPDCEEGADSTSLGHGMRIRDISFTVPREKVSALEQAIENIVPEVEFATYEREE